MPENLIKEIDACKHIKCGFLFMIQAEQKIVPEELECLNKGTIHGIVYTVSICTTLALGFAAMYSSYSLLVRPLV